MLKCSQIVFRTAKTTTRIPQVVRLNVLSSSPTVADIKQPQEINILENATPNVNISKSTHPKPKNSMVASVFASIKAEPLIPSEIPTPVTDEKVKNATTVNELLSISEGTGTSRKHALKVVSVLADWTNSGKISLIDFESDPRFIKLCRILTKNNNNKNIRTSLASRSEDLSTILSVAADDEAAKLVASITLPQMVKVMSTLSQKKRRSTLLLRALSYNITGCSDKLDLKQSSDLLFSMSSLNYFDENLLSKITEDVILHLKQTGKKSAVVGSIITSVGLLRYKDETLLDALSEWMLENSNSCRPQDIFSFLMTLGILNYLPSNAEKLFEVILPHVTKTEASKPTVWLEVIWSLVLLNKATPEHVSSVLEDSFVKSLLEQNATPSAKLKLANINGAAEYLVKDYKGPKLSKSSEIHKTMIAQTREKNKMVDLVVETLKNLITSDELLRAKVNTGHGFFIDVECLMDNKVNPLPLNSPANVTGTKVAFMVYDYHDMCRGRTEPTGINKLAARILEAQSYKLITVPFTEFNSREKVIQRVKYLETKLKETCRAI